MDVGIKDAIKSTDLLYGEKYDLESDEYQDRQVNDLFANKIIDHLHCKKNLLQRCKHFMTTNDYADLVKTVSSHLSNIVEKAWIQMRVNVNGGLMMDRDLRTLIDQISDNELESGSVRSCFSRLTALVWLVNLENPSVLIEKDTLDTSKKVLACLTKEEVCQRLHLRLDFRRNFNEKTKPETIFDKTLTNKLK